MKRAAADDGKCPLGFEVGKPSFFKNDFTILIFLSFISISLRDRDTVVRWDSR